MSECWSVKWALATGMALVVCGCVDSGPVVSELPGPQGGVYGGSEEMGGQEGGQEAGELMGGLDAGEQAGEMMGGYAGEETGGSMGGELAPPCEIISVLERNTCSSAGCHATPIQGNLDLSGDDLSTRLLNAPSHTIGCEGRRLIDGRDWTRSLLLQAVGSEDAVSLEGDTCQVVMPPSGQVPEEDLACLSSWVQYVASLDDMEMDDIGLPPTTASALRKVKTIIGGGEVTAAEVMSAEENGIRSVVETWTQTEAFEAKMLEFFTLTLQQRVTSLDLNQFGRLRSHRSRRGQLERAMEEVIPRTALHIITNDQPLSEVVRTRTFMMNTASLVTMLFPDQSDDQRTTSHFASGDVDEVPSQLRNQIAQKRWYIEGLTGTCNLRQSNLLEMFNGFVNNNRCGQLDRSYRFANTPLVESDFTDWRLVTINANGGASDDELIPFYDLVTLRETNQLTTRLPRVGFFTSNAFFNQWPTNVDNQFRVTVNQALLAALHIGFASSEPTEPIQMDALDAEHAEPGTECYGCHRQLDPMRVYFGGTYNADYRFPTTANGQERLFSPLPRASFAFRGETNDGGRVGRFAQNIANHPRWSSAWVQKVCLFANSTRCDESDPVFIEIRDRFNADQRFIPMLVDVLSSPLVTGLELIDTREAYPIVSITRREQLCSLLGERTRVNDLCDRNIVRRSLGLIPIDSYSRGAVDFTQPALASPFFYAAAEAVCEAAATVVVTGASQEFSFNDPEGTLEKLVTQLMSIQLDDLRFTGIHQALNGHFEALRADGLSARDAMRSVFTIACLSPDVMGIGL